MKTSKFMVATIATSALVLLSFNSTFAMYGQWNNWGNWNKWNMWWMWSNYSYNISNIAKSDLNATETDLLFKQYEEEMMANQLYTLFYEKYDVLTFKNIADSEKTHMEAVKTLLDRYELSVPTTYTHIQSLYDELKTKWNLSLKDALEVWIKIEIVDINDIVTAIKSTDNADIKNVLVNIWWASYNHMRWFIKWLNNNNLTTSIDYSAYLTQDDLNTKWSLSYKLVDLLKSQWIDLTDYVNQWWYKWTWSWSMSWTGNMMNNSYWKWWMNNNSNMRMRYKSNYENKYWDVISKMDDTKLEEFMNRIDELINKINTWDYTDVIKQKYNTMLLVLKEIASDNLDEQGLFQWLFD